MGFDGTKTRHQLSLLMARTRADKGQQSARRLMSQEITMGRLSIIHFTPPTGCWFRVSLLYPPHSVCVCVCGGVVVSSVQVNSVQFSSVPDGIYADDDVGLHVLGCKWYLR